MKRGDSVLLVHGLGEPTRVKVREILPGERVSVDFPTGGHLVVHRGMLVEGQVRTPGAGFRVTDPDTAMQAARATLKGLRTAQWEVLDAIVRAGESGLMDCEHEVVSGSRPDSAGVRRKELERLGLVADSGRKRMTPRKRYAVVWVATALGRAAWQAERKDGAA